MQHRENYRSATVNVWWDNFSSILQPHFLRKRTVLFTANCGKYNFFTHFTSVWWDNFSLILQPHIPWKRTECYSQQMVENRTFTHFTSVPSTRARLAWIFLYICRIFVHHNLDLAPLFGMREPKGLFRTIREASASSKFYT